MHDAGSPHVHCIPANDLIDHDTEHQESCVCGPTVEVVRRADGSNGWLYVHHSLDGRELSEPNHPRGEL